MFRKEKISDVTYLNFAALAYNNWSGIPCGTDLKDAVFDIRKKNTKKLNTDTRHLYMVYSECEKYETPLWDKHFDGWKFLYAANRTKLGRDMFGFDLSDNGFYAVAFVNENTNDVIISFRGTDSIKDMTTDVWLGFFDNYSTQLTCVTWFEKYCRQILTTTDKFPTVLIPTIHFTGHSLGGALAEYAHITRGEIGSHSVTWNGLGIGARLRRKLDNSLVQIGAITDILSLLRVPNCVTVAERLVSLMKDKITNSISFDICHQENYTEDSIREEVKKVLMSECSHFDKNLINVVWKKNSKFFKNLKYEFGFMPSMKREEREKEIQDVIMKDAGEIMGEQYFKYVVEEIVAVITGLKTFNENWVSKGYEEDVSGLTTELRNFIFKDDWTSIIHKRCGITVDVTSNTDPYRESNDDILDNDGKLRVLKETLDNFGFRKHGIGNFIMYLDDDGNISQNNIRKSILYNVIRSSIPFDANYLSKTLNKIQDDEYEVSESYEDVIVGLPTLMAHDNTIKQECSKKYCHWNLYCPKMDFISFSSSNNVFEIGSWNNMNFDNIDGTANRIKIRVTK